MRVKVYNDNPHVKVWKEQFKGEPIEIKYGTPLEMEFYEGHEFKGQYYPPVIKPDETQDPKSFKMIRVEKIEDTDEQTPEDGEIFKCQACKKTFNTEKALHAHSDKTHGDAIVIDPVIEKEIARKRGRPPKEATTTETT